MFGSLYRVVNWSLISLGDITRSEVPNRLRNPH